MLRIQNIVQLEDFIDKSKKALCTSKYTVNLLSGQYHTKLSYYEDLYPINNQAIIDLGNFLQINNINSTMNEFLLKLFKRYLIKDTNYVFFNCDLYNINQEIKFHYKNPVLKDQLKNAMLFLEYSQINFWMYSKYKKIFLAILTAKIYSLGCFLHEINIIFNIKYSMPIKNNYFFKNILMAQKFLKELNITINLNMNFINKSFQDIFLNLYNEPILIKENFMWITDYTYYPQAQIYHEGSLLKLNAQYVKIINTIPIKTNIYPMRMISFQSNKSIFYTDKYQLYCNEILKLATPSMKIYLKKILIDFFNYQNNLRDSFFFMYKYQLIKFLTNIRDKIIVLKEQLFYNIYPCYLLFKATDINYINLQMYTTHINKILIIDLAKHQIYFHQYKNHHTLLLKNIKIYY